MATWVGKITLACPSGKVVRKVTGSPDSVIKQAMSFDPRKAGAGCSVHGVEILKRGTGAGARDRYEGESPFEGGRRRRRGGMSGWWPFGKKKKAKRSPMSKRVMYIPSPGGGLTNRLAGGRGRKRKRSR